MVGHFTCFRVALGHFAHWQVLRTRVVVFPSLTRQSSLIFRLFSHREHSICARLEMITTRNASEGRKSIIACASSWLELPHFRPAGYAAFHGQTNVPNSDRLTTRFRVWARVHYMHGAIYSARIKMTCMRPIQSDFILRDAFEFSCRRCMAARPPQTIVWKDFTDAVSVTSRAASKVLVLHNLPEVGNGQHAAASRSTALTSGL